MDGTKELKKISCIFYSSNIRMNVKMAQQALQMITWSAFWLGKMTISFLAQTFLCGKAK